MSLPIGRPDAARHVTRIPRRRLQKRHDTHGFSWLDLYLMGLARADEVPPSFYIDSAQPPLGLEYWPPSGVSVSGSRRDFRIEDIIAAMGSRDPSCELAQRTFTVYFVLLAGDAGGVARRVDVMRRIRSARTKIFLTLRKCIAYTYARHSDVPHH